MKKLMTMIAAVATAFGLYADDMLNNSVDFSEFSNTPLWQLTDKDGNADELWSYTGGAPVENEAKIESGKLVLKTGQKVLSRAFAKTAPKIGEGLYADMILDLNGEALDEVPNVTDGKLALFALDGTDIEGLPDGTNVYVYAAYGTDGKALFQLKDNGETFVGSARRIAVKAYENVLASGSRAGFLVFISNDDVAISEADIAKVEAFFTYDGAKWVTGTGDYLGGLTIASACSKWTKGTQKSLFVSMDSDPDTGDTLAAVDFKGNAKLASITLTDADPGFPADNISMTLTLTDATITGLTDGYEVAEDGKSIVGPAEGNITFKVSATKQNVTVTLNGAEQPAVADVYTVAFAEGSTLTVKGWDAAATVTIGGGVETSYPTIADAINAADGAGAACTLKLSQDLADQTSALDFENIDNEITLDLNGKTITFTSETAFLSNAGKLKIIDSLTGGKIVAFVNPDDGGFDSQAVENSGELAIVAGTFDGEVTGTGTFTITGGAFDKAHNGKDEFALTPADDYEAVSGEDELADYWVVRPAAPKTFSVTAAPAADNSTLMVQTNGVDLTGVENVYIANIGDTIVVTYTAVTGYEFNGQPTMTFSFKEDDDTTFATAPTPTIKTFELTLPTGVNASAVVSNATEDITAALTAIDYGTKVTVYWTANAGYKITEGATEEITMIANKTAKVPTVEAEAQPVTPGQDVEIPTGETAESYKEKINDPSTGLKEKLLVAPNDGTVPTTEAYRNLFQAVAAGDKVTFEMIPAEEAKLKAAALEDAAAALDADAGEVAITNPISGLYYGLKQANALADMAVTDKELSNGSKLSFTITVKGEDAGFWQVLIGTKESDIENPAE